jgi:prepilin-type N-terminal cleavage/methylation domain-containing protein
VVLPEVKLTKLIKQMVSSQKGLTLPEVLIALVLFGLVGAGVMFGLDASNKTIVGAHEITTAESLTRTVIEYVKRSPYDSEVVTTNLAGAIDDDPALDTISVDDTADFPTSGIIQIEDELIQYDEKTGGQFGTAAHPVIRGFAGTDVDSHPNNTVVVDTPVYDVTIDVGVDLAGDPYYGDYVVDVGILYLDPEADGIDNDDGLQKMMIQVRYHGRVALKTEAYKVDR